MNVFDYALADWEQKIVFLRSILKTCPLSPAKKAEYLRDLRFAIDSVSAIKSYLSTSQKERSHHV